jgi:hypothetical protein
MSQVKIDTTAGISAGIMARTVGFEAHVSCLGTSRKISSDMAEIEGTDPSMLRLSKQILDSPQLAKIVSLRGELARRVEKHALPCSMFKSGVKLIGIGSIDAVQAIVNEYAYEPGSADPDMIVLDDNGNELPKGKIPAVVDEFVAEYPNLVNAARERLGELFDPADYPPAERVREAFGVDYRYFTFDTPQTLKSISKSLYNRERKKAERSWSEAEAEIRNALRAGFVQLVEHLKDRLTPDSDGKKKRLHESAIENFREFMTAFEGRNVTDDAELGSLVAKAKALVDGVGIESLRESDDLRSQIVDNLATIAESAGSMTVKVTRKVNLRSKSEAKAA